MVDDVSKNKKDKLCSNSEQSGATGKGSIAGNNERRASPKKKKMAKRKRLSPNEREQMILDGATRFFADHGFESSTRDLAERIGISQALLYRYFKNKGNLIERVYERVFLQRWSPEWADMLSDRSQSVENRLKEFYRSYLRTIDEYSWVRIAMYSGLAGNDLTMRYLHSHVEGLLELILEEIRVERGGSVGPKEPLKLEQVWMLHSSFIHYITRKHVYGTPVDGDVDSLVDLNVHVFLYGSLANTLV